MKTKKILMSLLLVMGAIAAKASGYPPELALVSQPVMVYNYNSVTVYYDVENIGDYTYRGYVYLYLDPDDGYAYAEEHVRIRPGRIKRISIEIPSYRIDPYYPYTIMPYYELGNELYSFTTFEYFEPLYYYWNGPRTAYWIVTSAPPRVRHYTHPGTYRYYYDGYRPPMPPPGHDPGMPPPPMDPMHHTYNYHHNNGGYPTHNEWNHGEAPKPNNGEMPKPNNEGGNASVRPKPNGGSMSSGSNNSGSGSNSGSVTPPSPSTRPRTNSGSVSGRTNNGSSRPSGTSTGSSSSGRTNNSSGGSSSGRVNSSSNSRPSGTSTSSSSSSTRSSSSSGSSTRSSSSSGSSTRSSNSGSTRSSGTSSSSSSTRSSSSSNTRSSSSSGRR